jgi:hypothetical protein
VLRKIFGAKREEVQETGENSVMSEERERRVKHNYTGW